MNSFPSQHFSDKQEPSRLSPPKFSFRKLGRGSSGFTLIEMLVVAAIIVFLSTSLIANFSRSRIDIDQTANLIMATVREAQSKAVSSTVYNGYNPCGYGLHYTSSTQISIYVGPNASLNDCPSINKNYQADQDTIIKNQTISDSRVEIKTSFNDIFFLPPDPKTYLNNQLNQPAITIQIGQTGVACPTNCRTISVYSSGLIESQ